MYVQCSTVIRKGTVSRNRKLVESYRDPVTRKPRNRTVQRLESLPMAERAKLIYEHGGKKYLTPEEWSTLNDLGLLAEQQADFDVGDVYYGGGTAVAFKNLKESGMFEVLDKNLSRRSCDVLKELIIHQLIRPKSKLRFTRERQSGLLYLLGGKRKYKEDKVYMAMDELAQKMESIKVDLTKRLDSDTDMVLLYDLSNSYFTGTKAELGGRGDSKEKRHDRYIVTYGLVMNHKNMPLDIRIWKGGTADSETVLETFSEWKRKYNAKQAIWIADRSMSGEPCIENIKKLNLNYITGLPGSAQLSVLMDKHESTPELFDTFGLTSFESNGKRYILCRHHSKGYRKERKSAKRRRRAYDELIKIQESPQNKNDKKLYHRAMRVLEKYEQTHFWKIDIIKISSKEKTQRYRLDIYLNRQTVIKHDKLGHFYILQTDMDEAQMSKEQIVSSYKSLIRVEKSFRDIKSHIKIRPIRHRRERRIKGHIYLCYLSLWLSKYIENQWNERSVNTEVGPTLLQWDQQLVMCEKIDQHRNMVEVKWNKGNNARQTANEIEMYGESLALKAHS